MSYLRLAPFALLAAVLLAPCPRAAAETLTCTDLPALPATITTPGHYCLNRNFSQAFTTAAINIAASNVLLDCNGHAVTQTASNGVAGVYASNRRQVTVQGCTLNSFGRGIALFESDPGASQDNRVVGNELRGSQITAIQVAGSGTVIDDNHISGNVGSTADANTYGILVSANGQFGTGTMLRRNVVTRFAPTVAVNPVAIYVLSVYGPMVTDNHVDSMWAPAGRQAYGIVFAGASLSSLAARNHVVAAIGVPPNPALTYGGTNLQGIYYQGVSDDAVNVCRENVVGHWVTNIMERVSGDGCVKLANIEF
jgi:hypothetical protein